MIDKEQYRLPGSDTKRMPRHETPGLIEKLESLGFRPFTEEW